MKKNPLIQRPSKQAIKTRWVYFGKLFETCIGNLYVCLWLIIILFTSHKLQRFSPFNPLSCFALAQQNKKPNVLFIISDDLTTTAVSSYENQTCQTPHIDPLGSKGIRFT